MKDDLFEYIEFELFKKLFNETFGFFSYNLDRFSVNSNKKFVDIPWLQGSQDTSDYWLGALTNLKPFQGKLYIVPFDSKEKPFIVESENMEKFIEFYDDNFGYFFDCDLMIVNFEKKYFWLKNHEDYYTFIDYNRIDEYPLSSNIYETNPKFDIYNLSKIAVDINLKVDFKFNKKYSNITEKDAYVKILGIASYFKAEIIFKDNQVTEITKDIPKNWFETIEYTVLDLCINYINNSISDSTKIISVDNVSIVHLHLLDKHNEAQNFTTIGNAF